MSKAIFVVKIWDNIFAGILSQQKGRVYDNGWAANMQNKLLAKG
jgi:hypothetical protein